MTRIDPLRRWNDEERAERAIDEGREKVAIGVGGKEGSFLCLFVCSERTHDTSFSIFLTSSPSHFPPVSLFHRSLATTPLFAFFVHSHPLYGEYDPRSFILFYLSYSLYLSVSLALSVLLPPSLYIVLLVAEGSSLVPLPLGHSTLAVYISNPVSLTLICTT